LFSIGTTAILDETISLLNVGFSKIKINAEFKPKQGILDQRVIELMASTIKTT
jgi:hypothetical protein